MRKVASSEASSAGPIPAWLIGNIGQIQTLGGAALAHAYFSKLYGPVYATFGAPQPWVVTDSPALAHEILEQHSIRPTMPSLLYGTDRQFDQANILAARGDKHRSLRGAWLPLFSTGRHACQAETHADKGAVCMHINMPVRMQFGEVCRADE